MPKARPIRTQPSTIELGTGYRHLMHGWLAGKDTYLCMSLITPKDKRHTLAIYDGRKLYRLAKAIVRQYEEAHDDH